MMYSHLLVALKWPRSLLHICTARGLVQEIKSILADFKDWKTTVCRIQMFLHDRNVELCDLFPEISCLMIGSQFKLSQFLLVLAHDARLRKFADKAWRWASIKHFTDHFGERLLRVLTPILLGAILRVGLINCPILSCLDGDN